MKTSQLVGRVALAVGGLLAGVFALPLTARAASMTVPVTADTEIFTDQTVANTNTSSTVSNANAGQTAAVMYVGYAGYTQPFKILLQFDLSSIPANQVIQSATLHLTPVGGTSVNVELHRLLVSWVEGDGVYPGPGTTGATWLSRDKSGSNL